MQSIVCRRWDQTEAYMKTQQTNYPWNLGRETQSITNLLQCTLICCGLFPEETGKIRFRLTRNTSMCSRTLTIRQTGGQSQLLSYPHTREKVPTASQLA